MADNDNVQAQIEPADETAFRNALQGLDLRLKLRDTRGALAAIGVVREAAMRIVNPEIRTDALNAIRELENGLSGRSTGSGSVIPRENRIGNNNFGREQYEQTNRPPAKKPDLEL